MSKKIRLLLAIVFTCIFCLNCRPLTTSEASNLYSEPSMTRVANLNWNTLCFNPIKYIDDQNYELSINVEDKRTLYLSVQKGELKSIKYQGSEKELPTIQNIIYYIKERSR